MEKNYRNTVKERMYTRKKSYQQREEEIKTKDGKVKRREAPYGVEEIKIEKYKCMWDNIAIA